ncbi:GGDEF domain-containing protein [Arsenicicoccus sp. oral taxon 190]|uniref:GGDEF domain-containing protein n=1 Tax=Arsenicicoccus sp. oral taxon 190 TaxID=1658671 RepID=UPI00067B2E72|nr:GGDEF domain-containing protein [Arsenicicoccus sp. oral taxon 190]
MTEHGRHRKEERPPEGVLEAPPVEALRDELKQASATFADRFTAAALALMVVVTAVVMAVSYHQPVSPSDLLAIPLVVLYVIGYRTVFPSAAGGFVATEPLLVALLMTLPAQWAMTALTVAVTVGGLDEWPRSHVVHGLLQRVGQACHGIGPVLVLALAGWPDVRHVGLGTLLLALAAQFVFDGTAALVRGSVQGVTPRQMARPLLWTFSVDALLAPIGFCIVVTAQDRPVAYLLLATPIVLVRLMKADRESHRRYAEQMQSAYTEVREQVQLDPLTGLHNRRAWDEAVAQAAVEVNNPDRRSAIVLIADVDHLKVTNDTLGHDSGDTLLQEVGRILQALAPSDATVARLGGDEFGVLFTVSTGYLLPDFVGRARAALEAATLRVGHLVSASVGVAVCPPGGSVADAVRRADRASAQDKSARRAGRVAPWPESLREGIPVTR